MNQRWNSILFTLVAAISLTAGELIAAPASGAEDAKNKLRELHRQLLAAAPGQKEAVAKQMIELTGPLVKAEPDALGGWLLQAEAAVALKDVAACQEAEAQLQRLQAAKSGNPLAVTVLGQLKAMAAAGATAMPAAPTVGASKQRLQAQPNGDHILTGLPKMEDFPAQARGEDYAAALVWMQYYYGWKADVAAALAQAGAFDDKSRFTTYFDFIQKFMPEKVGKRFNGTRAFQTQEVMHILDRGEPVMVWRIVTPERMKVHADFAKTFAQDPKARLPAPKNAAERKNWPAFNKTLYDAGQQTEVTSVVIGYNKERGEVIFIDFKSADEGSFRMTGDEMQATCRVMLTFE